jgi:hypothetical protein
MEFLVSLDRLEDPGACVLLRAGVAHFLIATRTGAERRALSINRLLEELCGIRETLVVNPRRPGQRQASTATCLTRMTALQQRLFSLLGLQQFVPATR